MKYPPLISRTGYKKFILGSSKIIKELNELIDLNFPYNFDSVSTKQFREIILLIQNKINKRKLHHDIVLENAKFFDNLFANMPYSITSVAHIRGVRPSSKEPLEFLNLHRENFYSDGDYINYQINVQIPIRNYTEKSSMYYIPRSHMIPDSALNLEKMSSSFSKVEKFSTGHKIGLTYNPKFIKSGVERAKARRVKLNPDQGMAFTSRLIHGGGANLTKTVRFTLDFGLIPDIQLKNAKKDHFASYSESGAPYESINGINGKRF